MRVSPLMIAVALGLGLPANHSALAASDVQGKLEANQAGLRTYIVTLDEQPLATFTGFGAKDSRHPRMAATSPSVTGERKLNVKSVEAMAYRQFLRDKRTGSLNDAAVALGRPLSPRFVYDVVLNGFSAELTAAEAAKLRTMRGIARVTVGPERHLLTDRGPKWIGAGSFWTGAATGTPYKGEGVVVGVIDGGINSKHDSFKAIGPADSYSHVNPRPAFLGRCTINATLCNSKLIGVWDYIANPSGTTADGLDGTGHGTHTASTAAGNAVNVTYAEGSISSPVQMSGVAPHANIIAYKVCATNTCDPAAIIAAIERATIDQVDVINFSIGGPPVDPFAHLGGNDDDDAEAFLAARAAGVTVAVSAGNDGPEPGTLGNPSNAPWVMSVAMATHDRSISNRLISMTGGATAPPSSGILVGTGDVTAPTATAIAPIVMATDFPLCGSGPNDINITTTPYIPTGASKPAAWTASTFAGKIVVCQRGTYARTAKAKNLQLAGAIGMILVNTAAEGISVIEDDYPIPTTHLNYTDGLALTTWLSSGAGHSGKLEGSALGGNPVLADVLDPASGRGPVVPMGVVKPDLTAPGVNIIAASSTINSCATSPITCYRFLTGTSMASPHVAGASALLAGAKPAWSPSQIISALTLTAYDGVRDYTGLPATPHDRGAGRVDLARAIKAGLYLNVTDAEFRGVNASNAHTLNLPSLGYDDCFGSCALLRRFTDMAGGGTYAITSSLPAGVTMTPSATTVSFANGATVPVTFTFNVRNAPALFGKWIYGSVILTDTTAAGHPTLKLPVAIFSSPGTVPSTIQPVGDVNLERGYFDKTLSGLVGLPNARFVTTDLVTPNVTTASLLRDDDTDPMNACGAGATPCNYDSTITIPASPVGGPVNYRVSAVTSSTELDADFDLIVGIDANGDGKPATDERVCVSGSDGADESCIINVRTTSAPQTVWVRINRFVGDTAVPNSAVVTLETTSLGMVAGTARSLVATGPGHPAESTPFSVRFGYDDPTFLPGQRRVGALLLQGTPGTTIAEIPVVIKRSAAVGFAPFALTPGVARNVTLATGGTHDKLFFEVPAHASSVTFSTTGSGSVRLDVYRVVTPAGPTIPAAPGGATTGTSGAEAGATHSVTLSGAALPAGRYYLKPTNTGASTTSVAVKAVVNTATALKVKNGSYYNPARGGHGMFLYTAGTNQLQLIWYTYFQDGTPTWYFVQNVVPGANGIWNAGIYRAAWNGTTNALTQVGDLVMTPTTNNSFNVSYNLDGETGSEPMAPYVTGCPVVDGNNLDVSAHWYSPGNDGFGYSVQYKSGPGYEFIADFVFDGIGVPRFLLAERNATIPSGASTLPLDQIKGFCPLCTNNGTTRSTVGTLTRTIGGGTITAIGSTATFNGGVPGTWNATFPVSRLGDSQGCAP